jgi:thiamine pyrophosphate-dependent acetolactate synthase large subunit-like protein
MQGARLAFLQDVEHCRLGPGWRLFAERLSAPVAKPLLGKAAMPDTHPYCVGGVGLLGTAAGEQALQSCDTLLILGSSFPYIEHYPKPGSARAVQIDCDSTRIGLRYPVECGLVGDAAATLDALLPLLRQRDETFSRAYPGRDAGVA